MSVAQPPETSYADDQKYTKAAIDAMDGPVVLVGHSYGGSIITEAGNDPNVAALVYIAAFALDDGESCASIEQAVPQASKAFKPDSNGNWWISQAHFAADFAADVPPGGVPLHGYRRRCRSPTDAFTHKVTNPAWKTKPTWYMVASQDRSINPIQERMMAKRANARTVEVNSQPRGLHVAAEGDGQAHRRGRGRARQAVTARPQLRHHLLRSRRPASHTSNSQPQTDAGHILKPWLPRGQFQPTPTSEARDARAEDAEEDAMPDRVTIKGHNSRNSAPTSCGRRRCLHPQSLFFTRCLA